MQRLLQPYAAELAEFWPGEIRWDHPLAAYTTLGVGGAVEALLTPAGEKELTVLLPWLAARHIPWRVIGRGSNILVPDRGLTGVAIILGRDFEQVAALPLPNGDAGGPAPAVRAGAACSLARLVGFCTEAGLSGLEFLTGIPGTVGGAVVMNAGAHGREIRGPLLEITVIDDRGEMRRHPARDLPFGYRAWGGHPSWVVTGATFALVREDRPVIESRCRALHQQRQATQPLQAASAGSFFKNPPGEAAGRLIEVAGLKGLRRGGAMVSEKHANFIVNTGRATAADILALMREVQERVLAATGIRLEPEVRILDDHHHLNRQETKG